MEEGKTTAKFSKEAVANTVFLSDREFAQAALHHLDFLQEVDGIRSLRDMKVIRNALYRYEKLWLPLAAAHLDEILMPPIDVHWCWHSHILAPRTYKKDCLKQVGCEINHRLVSVEERASLRKKAKALWREAYPDEPFNLDLSTVDVPDREGFKSELEYNVELATTRQKTFYYNASLPHFRNAGFLQRGIIRYKKFLFLRRLNKDLFIVPFYDQDLLWHTHQLFPQNYAKDTTAFLGVHFHHDDTDGGDRTPESKLVIASVKTKEAWKETFNEAQDQPGCCYRGGIRHHDLCPITPADLSDFQSGQDAVFLVEGPTVDDFSHKLDMAMTTAGSADYTLKCGETSVMCQLKFHKHRNVFFTMSINDKPVVIGRNISNYEIPLPRQVSEGPGSGLVMKSKNGDIGMVLVDAIGDWSVSKINKVAAMWPGTISTWYRGSDGGMVDEAADQQRSKYAFDSNINEIRVVCDQFLVHHLAAAFVDLVLRKWPEIGKKPMARVITDTATSNCALL